MRSRSLLLVLAAVTLVAAIDWPSRVPAPTGNSTWAPLVGLEGEVIDSKYVVIFQHEHTLEQHFAAIGQNLSGLPEFENLPWIPGYTALFLENATLDIARSDPNVVLVETDRPVHLISPVESEESETATNTSIGGSHGKREYQKEITRHAGYGLRQVAAGSKLRTPVKGGNYNMVHLAGLGTQIYILDSGIRLSHTAFGGRAANFPPTLKPGDNSPYVDGPPDDTFGHGTHVAGIAAGSQYGVAPYANLWNVKVLGRGTSARRIAQAVNDVTVHHNSRKASNPSGFRWRGSVINMSFTHGFSFALYMAVENAHDAGISVIAAAGNSNKGSSGPDVWPCAFPTVTCVGAVDRDYIKAPFSNWGSNVRRLAPGRGILSCWNRNDTDTHIYSGTSMASAYVSGAAAIFTSWLGLAGSAAPAQDYIWWNSLKDISTGWPLGTENVFVTTGINSTQKSANEPFRWAGDYPRKNPQTTDATPGYSIDITASRPPLSELLIGPYNVWTAAGKSAWPHSAGLDTDNIPDTLLWLGISSEID